MLLQQLRLGKGSAVRLLDYLVTLSAQPHTGTKCLTCGHVDTSIYKSAVTIFFLRLPLAMRKRDRLRALLVPSASSTSTSTSSVSLRSGSPLPPPSPPPHTPNLIASHAAIPTQVVIQNPALKKAVVLQLQNLPEIGRAAFAKEINTIDEQALLSKVQAYDTKHKNESSFRPHAQRLARALGLFNRLLGGVAIGIQADPTISAPVVGVVRVAIDLGLQFANFFPRLTDMVCEFEDYLGPLAEHSQAADIELVENAVVGVYTNVLDFGWKARCVFVDTNGEKRKWTSFRAFMRQHWDTFEAEFVSIKEDMRHNLHVLQHTVQATHFNAFRSVEQSGCDLTATTCAVL